jgi:hypothetical protein
VTALPWLAALAVLVTVLFVGWSWFMNRWDEREERRHREELLS